MKVLFYRLCDPVATEAHETACEYLTDALYHGLLCLPDVEVTDWPPMWHMHQDTLGEKHRLYGLGHTLYGKLPHPGSVDRTSLLERDFDLVLFPLHCSRACPPHDGNSFLALREVEPFARKYPASRLAFIDTNDNWDVLKPEMHGLTTYFKRELRPGHPGHYRPIGYGVPKDRITPSFPAKERDWSDHIPGSTGWVCKTEEEYYQQYARSRFGWTWKKGGWDCMRHYEILAAGAIPYFRKLEECPPQTMVGFPKELVRLAMTMPGVEDGRIVHSCFSESLYTYFLAQLLDWTRTYLTTESLARYVLQGMG